jgi:methyl-accepting chemotaxis protein
MNIGTKIIVAALVAILLTVSVALVVQNFVIHRQGADLTIETMRAAIVEAENVRESISRLGQGGAFDRAKLLAEYRASGDLRSSTLYRTIPVVAAWEAIARAAQENGFEFRVPKHRARNPPEQSHGRGSRDPRRTRARPARGIHPHRPRGQPHRLRPPDQAQRRLPRLPR